MRARPWAGQRADAVRGARERRGTPQSRSILRAHCIAALGNPWWCTKDQRATRGCPQQASCLGHSGVQWPQIGPYVTCHTTRRLIRLGKRLPTSTRSRAARPAPVRTPGHAPAGLSPGALRGMVAAHGGAGTVLLARAAPALRHSHHFSAVWAALAAGSAARPGGGAPISAVDLRGCAALASADVAALCAALPALRCARRREGWDGDVLGVVNAWARWCGREVRREAGGAPVRTVRHATARGGRRGTCCAHTPA